MNLIISAEYTAPPSEVYAFRDLTLYATLFRRLDCLVEARAEEIDFYYKWLCGKYAKDYVKQLIRLGEERDGIKIRYRTSDRLTFDNLDSFILLL